jgi:hypothetical protein
MWRISALLWSAAERCEDWATQRRIQYCVQRRQRAASDGSTALTPITWMSKLRTLAAFLFVLFAGRS